MKIINDKNVESNTMISFDYTSKLKFRCVLIGVFASKIVSFDPAFTSFYSFAGMTRGIMRVMLLNIGLIVTKNSCKLHHYDIILSKLYQRYNGRAGGKP